MLPGPWAEKSKHSGLRQLENKKMFELLKHALTGQNQFASGGLLLMVIGGISVYLRAIPEKLWEWIVGQTTMVITVTDDDAAFVWVKEWFLQQKFIRRIRRVDLDTTMRNEQIALIPAPGMHWFWYGGRPFQVWFSRNESERMSRRVESFTFRTVSRKRGFLQRFVDDVVNCHVQRQGVKSYLYVYNDGWDYVEGYAPRLLESVVLEPGEKEHLVGDVLHFQRSKHRYAQLGVPYHRGYLLYGPPGTGKTSLVSALAAHFGLSIYAVNLAEFNDRSLMVAINQVPAKSLLLFEDIDCMKGGTARDLSKSDAIGAPAVTKNENHGNQNGVTLSGLLNVLDGFSAPTNVLFVMTTNRMEALDQALLRPGRIDYRLHLGKATDRQKIELYRRFFSDRPESEAIMFVRQHRSAETMAEFQGLLLALDREQSGWELESMEVPVLR
jgi:chaperone BCS1